MKKVKKVKIKSQMQVISFNVFRTIAICAVICTIAATAFLWWQSLLPGDKSKDVTDIVGETIKDNVDVIENKPAELLRIVFGGHKKSAFYVGDTEQLEFTFLPADTANKSLTYKSSNESVATVSDSGLVTYLTFGTAQITATSVAHPEISAKVSINCQGYIPDQNVTDIIMYPQTGTDPWTSAVVGKTVVPNFKDQSGRIIGKAFMGFSSKNPDILLQKGAYFYALKEGDATITITCSRLNFTKDIVIHVQAGDGYTFPTDFEFYEDTVIVSADRLWVPDTNISNALPSGAQIEMYSITVAQNDAIVLTPDGYYAQNPGETTVTVTPHLTPQNAKTFTVVVVEPIPQTITISGNVRIVSGQTYQYSAMYTDSTGLTAPMRNVRWEVVKGDATITDDGQLITDKLGSLKLRAICTEDESVYTEIKIRISLFESFYMFVRKVIGHFSGFAVLGFGFAVVYFLLLKPRWAYVPVAAGSGFLVALISEVFQMPIFTQGRYASWVDVMTDTFGVLTGIAIASAVMLIYLVVIRLVSKKQFEKVQRSLVALRPKTLFLSPSRTRALMSQDEYGLEQPLDANATEPQIDTTTEQ